MTKLFDLVHEKEVEFVKYVTHYYDDILGGSINFDGMVVRDADGNEYIMERHFDSNVCAYDCIRLVDNEWLDVCTEHWRNVYSESPAGYQFVEFRYPHELGMNHVALRKRTDEEMREMREWDKKIAEYDAYVRSIH